MLVAYVGRTEATLKLRELAEALSIDIARVSQLALVDCSKSF